MQDGGGETRDGVKAGLTEETHGAERVTAEERGGRAQGDLSMFIIYLTHILLSALSEKYVLYFFILSSVFFFKCCYPFWPRSMNLKIYLC